MGCGKVMVYNILPVVDLILHCPSTENQKLFIIGLVIQSCFWERMLSWNCCMQTLFYKNTQWCQFWIAAEILWDFCKKSLSCPWRATATCCYLSLSLLIILELYVNIWTITWTSNHFCSECLYSHALYLPTRQEFYKCSSVCENSHSRQLCFDFRESLSNMVLFFFLQQRSLMFSKCCDKVFNWHRLQEIVIEYANQQIFFLQLCHENMAQWERHRL